MSNKNSEKIERDYYSCVDYLMTNIKNATSQMKKDRINNGIIDIDLKLSQCESFIYKSTCYGDHEDDFGTRKIHKNNICYILQPLEYVQYKFPEYRISTEHNSNKLLIREVFYDFRKRTYTGKF